MDSAKAILTIHVSRGGLVDETLSFLVDIQNAYENLYVLQLTIDEVKRKYIKAIERNREMYLGLDSSSLRGVRPPTLRKTWNVPRYILPDDRLVVHKVNISSPGVWEFLGSLNPLLQLREYLKDLHERRKDKEWREAKEQQEINLKHIKLGVSILQEQIDLLKSIGYTDKQVRKLLDAHYFKPLSRLDLHSNSGLIEPILEKLKLDKK